jgi:hypothetical protein
MAVEKKKLELVLTQQRNPVNTTPPSKRKINTVEERTETIAEKRAKVASQYKEILKKKKKNDGKPPKELVVSD